MSDIILRQLDALPGRGDWNYLGPEAYGGAVHSTNGGPIIAAPPDGEMTTEWDMVAEFIARAPTIIRRLLDTDDAMPIVRDLALGINVVDDKRTGFPIPVCADCDACIDFEPHAEDCIVVRARALVARQGVTTPLHTPFMP